MTSAAKRILDEALALSGEEREHLVGALSRSLEPLDLDPEWHGEIARRVRKIESGDAGLQDADDHLEKLRAKLGG